MAPLTPRRCASVPCLTALHVDPGGGGGGLPSDSPTAAGGGGGSGSGGSPRAALFPRSAFAPAAATGERAARVAGVPHRSASAVCLTSLAGPPPPPRSGHRRQRSHLRGLAGLTPADLGWAAAARRVGRTMAAPAVTPVVASREGAALQPLVLFHGGPVGEPDEAVRAASGGGGGGSDDNGAASSRHEPEMSAPLLFGGNPPGAPTGATNSVVSATGVVAPRGGATATASTDGGAPAAGAGDGAAATGGDGGGRASNAPVSAGAAAGGERGGERAVAKKGEDGRDRRSLLAAVTMAVSLLGLPGRAAGMTELLASISLRGPLAARHPLFAGLSLAGDVASEALGNISCPPDGASGLFHDCAPHSAAMLIHLVVDVLNLSPY